MPLPNVAISLRVPPELYEAIEATRLVQSEPEKKHQWLNTLLRRGLAHTRKKPKEESP